MKKYLYTATLFTSILVASCGGEDKKDASITDEKLPQAEDTVTVNPQPTEEVVAIALWNTTLREEPVSSNVKWVSGGSVNFGNKLTLTGDTATEGKTAFSKVKLATGKEGWIKDYLIAKDAEVAVVIEPTAVYKNPDIMSLDRDKKLEIGEIVAVKNPKEDIGFVQFYGKEKTITGWVKKGESISNEDIDIEVAILRKDAMQEEDPAMKVMKIQEILDNSSYMSSKLYDNLAKKVQSEEEVENIDEEEMDVELEEDVIPFEDEEAL